MSQIIQKRSNQKPISARLQALRWLVSVVSDGRSVNDLLANPQQHSVATGEIAFAKQLLFGSLRYYHQTKAILDQLLEKPLKQKDLDIYGILILGIYQLRYLAVPDHAALSECVELTRKIKKNWASGLVNAVLRSYLRDADEIDKKLAKAKTYQYSHPNWIINQLELDWGADAKLILQANTQRAPMTLRVNRNKIGVAEYQKQLDQAGHVATCHPLASDALVMKSACDVYQLPGFEQGLVTVQDAAAQLAVDLLDLNDGQRVLDGCAAPGGKTTHILQRASNLCLTSVEMSETRINKIKQTLSRLEMSSNVICADILRLDDWWDGGLFDRVLIDVPCSASGVIRRNPDIKLHRKKSDLATLVELQQQILETCWGVLKPGGRLVYATCSVFKAENEGQMERFLAKHHANLVELPVKIASALVKTQHPKTTRQIGTPLGYQIFPGEAQMDGFYLCGITKTC